MNYQEEKIKINSEMYTGITYASVAIIIALLLYAIALYLNEYNLKKTLGITLASIASVILLGSSFVLVMILRGF